jgi:hypothetical protein
VWSEFISLPKESLFVDFGTLVEMETQRAAFPDSGVMTQPERLGKTSGPVFATDGKIECRF